MRRVLLAWVVVILACVSAPTALGGDTPRFEHSMWQWYEASEISAERMASVAPHFPHPTGSSALNRDLRAYNNALLRWTYLYPHEYEAFVNAPELAALNPEYRDYVKVYRRPRFMDVSITHVKPDAPAPDKPFEAQLYYELQLMKWIFLFHPDSFAGVYGFTPPLPDDFDVHAWRAKQIERALAQREDLEGDGSGPQPSTP